MFKIFENYCFEQRSIKFTLLFYRKNILIKLQNVKFKLFITFLHQQNSSFNMTFLYYFVNIFQFINMGECLNKLYNRICCKVNQPDPYEFDFVGSDALQQNRSNFQSNYVRTSKYTILTFLPVGLFHQFKRLANVYFLIIAILQSVNQISPLNPVTAWMPLLVVLSISMLRQGYQDVKRYYSDYKANYQYKTTVRRNSDWLQISWCDVIVGDLCLVKDQQTFPADMLLLSSSQQGGIAFIQTASLDGEKNLKIRTAWNATTGKCTKDLNAVKGFISCSKPSEDLHLETFAAQMNFDGQKQSQISFSKDKQFLFRGTKLKNTSSIIGLVIYTGHRSKIMLNSKSDSQKLSQIQVKVNYVLILILVVQLILSIIIAIIYSIFTRSIRDSSSYIIWNDRGVDYEAFLIFFTQFVLINTMIPISLIISIQIVKFTQSIFINNDKLMATDLPNRDQDKRNSSVKSASLNEQLGQIQYVFSDKTGTLTMNLMQLKIVVIGNQMYGLTSLLDKDAEPPQKQEKGFHSIGLLKLISLMEGDRTLDNPLKITDKNNGNVISIGTQRQLAMQYLKTLALAHETIVKVNQDGTFGYQGPSPDQITLVEGAKTMGIQFYKSTQQSKCLRINGQEKNFEVLQTFSFTSKRKRMSIIIKEGGTIKMYIKGADNIIQKRLGPTQSFNLKQYLHKFSIIGLRTLLVGMRTIQQAQYDQFKKKINSKQATQQQKEQYISQLEQNIYLLGGTAVLDRLQDDVPETIRDLLRANIKVWMLTGDKLETAQNIAKSCNLIQDHYEIIKFSPPSQSQQLLKYLQKLNQKSTELENNGIEKALLIEGELLIPTLQNPQCQQLLAKISLNFQSVVCCRLSPAQKASIVQTVRIYLGKITLAIGDGANDVSMIKSAHIGVGLYGEQGMGAAQASDYALPQFRMLWRLLFVHGRWNYIRISQMILYFFYKNMLFTIPQFLIAFYNGYSGQTMFADWYITFYNLIFTSLPLIFRAVFQQDINYVERVSTRNQTQQGNSQHILDYQAYHLSNINMKKQNSRLPPGFKINKYIYRLFPKIYFIGQENCVFNYPNYFMWVLEGILQAILITFFTIYIIGNKSLNQIGINSDFWIVGLTIFSCVILIVTVKLLTHTKFWTLPFFLITCLSLLIYAAYTWISNYIIDVQVFGTAQIAWQTGQTYFLVLFIICLILAIDGYIVHLDFIRGGYASKIRDVIKDQLQTNKQYLRQMSLRLTENLTQHHQ